MLSLPRLLHRLIDIEARPLIARSLHSGKWFASILLCRHARFDIRFDDSHMPHDLRSRARDRACVICLINDMRCFTAFVKLVRLSFVRQMQRLSLSLHRSGSACWW